MNKFFVIQFRNLSFHIIFIQLFQIKFHLFLHDTFLTEAIERNDIETVQKLLSANDINPNLPKVLIH